MYPGRGVSNTPHQTFPQGDGICKRRPNVRLFVPYGAIRWGVCNTPLPCDLETRCVLYFLLSSNTETRRVLHFLLSSNTETRRVLYFLLSSNTETRRVLHLLLSSNTETRRVLYFLPSRNTKTRRVLHFLLSREFEACRVLPLLFFFSCLDARKEAKENQGIRDASQVLPGTSLERSGFVPRTRQTSLPRQRPPAKLTGYMIDRVEIYCAFASSFSIVVFSLFIFLCLSSLFSSGRSLFRCSVMCAP